MMTLLNPTFPMSLADTDNPLHAPEILDWVKSAQTGDHAAFALLVQRFQRDVYAKAYSILKNHTDADDVVQETFLRAYRALPQFRFESSFRTWIITIATRQALGARERQFAHAAASLEDSENGCEHPALRMEAGQMMALLDEESRRLLREALARLPDRQKEALSLKLHKDWKYEQIAQTMKISVGSVKAHIFHAIQNLTRQLKGGAL